MVLSVNDMPKTCFFISRIGDPGSVEREFSDKLLRCIIAPVLQDCGYSMPVRADHITQPGVITTQVFTHLWNDDLVIADLTGSNPNVFYELAVRHIRRRPFVHLIQAGHKIPFDVAPNRTIEFDFDIEKAEFSKRALQAMINSAADTSLNVETPLSLAIGFGDVEGSSDPVRDGIAQILSVVQEVQGSLLRISEGGMFSVTRAGRGHEFQIRKTGGVYEVESATAQFGATLNREELDRFLRASLGDDQATSIVQVADEGRTATVNIAYY